jgi:hypothetical protein
VPLNHSAGPNGVIKMNAANTQKTRLTIENALFIAIMWGGAWALGFLLGLG